MPVPYEPTKDQPRTLGQLNHWARAAATSSPFFCEVGLKPEEVPGLDRTLQYISSEFKGEWPTPANTRQLIASYGLKASVTQAQAEATSLQDAMALLCPASDRLTGPITLHPWQADADLRRAEAALRALYGVLTIALDSAALAERWDDFRGSFGTPGRGPDGVNVDGVGLPDEGGFHALLNLSTALPDRDKHLVRKFTKTLAQLRGSLRDIESVARRQGMASIPAPDWELGEAQEAARQLLERLAQLTRTVDKAQTHAPEAVQYVTLSQVAALIGRNKRTLARWVNASDSGCPSPVVEGGGGRASEWNWHQLRPWLQERCNRVLPGQFPGMYAV